MLTSTATIGRVSPTPAGMILVYQHVDNRWIYLKSFCTLHNISYHTVDKRGSCCIYL